MEQAQRIPDEQLHPDFLADEENFRQAAGQLIERELQLRERVRGRVDVEPEERELEYIEGRNLIQSEYDRLTSEFSERQSRAVVEAERTLYRSRNSEPFQRALSEASAADDTRLKEMFQLATQSSLED